MPLRLLALGTSAMCGALGLVQVTLYFSGNAKGNGLWVVVLSALAGVAAVLLALVPAASIGAGAGLVMATLAFALWANGAISNGLTMNTELLLLLPIFLGCAVLLAAPPHRLITRSNGAGAAVTLDHDMATVVLAARDWSCSTCRYNLRGNLSGICPECQTPVKLLLAAPRGTTPVVLLRVVLVLLMARAGIEAYSFVQVLVIGDSVFSSYWSKWLIIIAAGNGVAALVVLAWAGSVLLRSLGSSNGRLTDHRLVVGVLRVVAFSLAATVINSILGTLLQR